jgi:type IV pilus assembly protein PilY1
MLYYERDLHSTLDNEVPTSSRDRALASTTAFENSDNEVMHQHMTTYTVGFGVTGNVLADPIDYTQSFDWGDPFNSDKAKNDDVRHTAYNGRGAYLDASNGANLSAKLIAAFAEF